MTTNELTMPVNFTGAEYAQLGAELEADATNAQLKAFYEKFRFAGDIVMATLAQFAFWRCSARCERLAGRIDAAMLADANADREYEKLPEYCRW